MSPQFRFVTVNLPDGQFEKINEHLMASEGKDLTELARDYPREAYSSLVCDTIATNDKDVQFIVDNEPISFAMPDDGPIIVADRLEKFPNISFTPVQVVVNVWRNPKFTEIIKRRSLNRIPKPIFSFYVEPPSLAF